MANTDQQDSIDRWLAAELSRIWLVAERSLRALQKAQIRPHAGHPSMAEVEGVLAARRMARLGAQAGSKPEEEASLNAAIDKLEQQLPNHREQAPFGKLITNLQLRPYEIETIVLAMAPHIESPLAELLQVLRGSNNVRRGVDLALLAQIFRLKRTDRVHLLDTMAPDRPLLRWRLIEVLPEAALESFGSLTHRAIRPSFQLLSMLCGRGDLDPALARCTKVYKPGSSNFDDLLYDEDMQHIVTELCNAAKAYKRNSEFPWLLLWGPRGAGKKTIARQVAASAGRPLITFDSTAVERGTFEDRFHRAICEAIIRDAVLYVGPLAPELLNDAGRPLVQRLLHFEGMVAIGVDAMEAPAITAEHPTREVRVKVPRESIRLELWQQHIPKDNRDSDLDLRSLSIAFKLTPGEILNTAQEALSIAQGNNRTTVQHAEIRKGIERRLRSQLGSTVRHLQVTVGWDDLVLPDNDMNRVQEFISRKKHRDQVYNQWGFGPRVGYGTGLIALFSGPPGTGKTMLALLIAKALDLDIYQVDLAQVISKWVGETEKQLAKVFDQAERAHAVLLFDEADSLFAKRTEVKTSNDRYGNLAVNYLLQRLEQYEGVAILTTNKEASLDEALQRRLSLHLHLEIPDVEERHRLWKSFVPDEAPIEDSIDFRQLAQDFVLSGGYVKNAAVRAAFLAASRGVPLGMNLFRLAAGLELEDMGRVVMRGDETHTDLLQQQAHAIRSSDWTNG